MGGVKFKGLASLLVDKHLKSVGSTGRMEEGKLACELWRGRAGLGRVMDEVCLVRTVQIVSFSQDGNLLRTSVLGSLIMFWLSTLSCSFGDSRLP